MLHHRTHPSDVTLLLAIDRELDSRRMVTLDRHLRQCERCRLRRLAFESTVADASGLYREAIARPIGDMDALRVRLRANMAVLVTTWQRSWWVRLRHAIATVPVIARVAGSLALIVTALPLVHPAPDLDPAPVATPIAPNARPVRAMTPGKVASVGVDSLCVGSLPARSPIPPATRAVVLRQYQMEHVAAHEYELDYLVTPELGGVADPQNLWPERYVSGVWNARVKDDLERLLPQLVCQGTIDLVTAQHDMADDWIAAYQKYFRTDRPVVTQAALIDEDDDDLPIDLPARSPRSAGVFRSAIVPLPVSFTRSTSPASTDPWRWNRHDVRHRP